MQFWDKYYDFKNNLVLLISAKATNGFQTCEFFRLEIISSTLFCAHKHKWYYHFRVNAEWPGVVDCLCQFFCPSLIFCLKRPLHHVLILGVNGNCSRKHFCKRNIISLIIGTDGSDKIYPSFTSIVLILVIFIESWWTRLRKLFASLNTLEST